MCPRNVSLKIIHSLQSHIQFRHTPIRSQQMRYFKVFAADTMRCAALLAVVNIPEKCTASDFGVSYVRVLF